MSQRLIDRLWDRHVVLDTSSSAVDAGAQDLPDLIYVDFHLIHESTSAQAFAMLRDGLSPDIGSIPPRRPDLALATADHTVPSGIRPIPDASFPRMDGETTEQAALLGRNAGSHGIELRSRGSGRQGIVHVIAPEAGLVLPGMTVMCGDSHTSTLGAFGAFAMGIGTSAVGQVLATQTVWLTRPKALLAEFRGALSAGVEAKDMILAFIQRIGSSGAQGYAIEFSGEAVRSLSMEGRMTLCNMAPEAGARAGMIGPDETTFAYLEGREFAPKAPLWQQAVQEWSALRTDEDAIFDKVVVLDAALIGPMVTWGTNPAMSVGVDENVPMPGSSADPKAAEEALSYMGLRGGERIQDLKVDTVFIGSCANSRLSDLRSAARVIGNSRTAKGTRAIVVPGSEAVAAEAEREGLREVFQSAGFEWGMPGCSMCVAMNGDKVAEGGRCAATSNRNFRHRQGPGSRTHLVSPATAAAAAISGSFVDVRTLL